MKAFSRLGLAGLGVFLSSLAVAHDAEAANVSIFDVRFAENTFPRAINAFGVVVGDYSIATTSHGFVRSPQGAVTPFDAPAPGLGDLPDTTVTGVNAFGRIIGAVSARDAFLAHAYVREPSGAFTTFDGEAESLVTYANAINLQGSIGGIYIDKQFVTRGYLRTADGLITTFDVPGYLDSVAGVTASDEVIGSYGDANGARRGFVRKPNGEITTFDVPAAAGGATTCGYCTDALVSASNLLGRVTGHYVDADGVVHGYLRKPTGAISTFDVPDAVVTLPDAINLEGDIAGQFQDSSDVSTGMAHGFLLDRSGTLRTFDVSPTARNIRVEGINLQGAIVGSFGDANGINHGFVWTTR